MLSNNLDSVTVDDILKLVIDKTPESRLLEYKQSLPVKGKDSDSKEFLADVAAFANAAGGDIVYGITEETLSGKNTGRPEKAIGLVLNGETEDEAIRRLALLCQNGLDPAIQGLRIREISGESGGGTFILIRVPRSWVAPHVVSLDGATKFYVRIDKAKVPMDREQIRQAFLVSDSARTRVERFRDERLGRILSNDLGVELEHSWIQVLHVVPIAGLDRSFSVDLSPFNPVAGLLPMLGGSLQRRSNVDGLMLAYDFANTIRSEQFIQLFHNGVVECMRTGRPDTQEVRADVPGEVVEQSLLQDFKHCIEFFKSQAVPTPVVVMLALLHVKGRSLLAGYHTFNRGGYHTFDRANVIVREITLDNYSTDPTTLLLPLLNSFWQAGGYDKSPSAHRRK